jgi:hypothetical protein
MPDTPLAKPIAKTLAGVAVLFGLSGLMSMVDVVMLIVAGYAMLRYVNII